LHADAVQAVFSRLGGAPFTAEDAALLLRVADADGDGRVTLADFRRLLDKTNDRAPTRDELRRKVDDE
jgi:hypothetical protein